MEHRRGSGTRAAESLLRSLIHERTGIYYDDDRIDLMMDRLSSLIIERGLSSVLDYYYLLKYDKEAATEWLKVIDAISVRETSFWREADQVRALVNSVVPEHFRTTTEPLMVWSAACASGEEPLTIAMALDSAGWLDRAPIVINASDASPAAIEGARRGIYRERALRNTSEQHRTRYFQKCGEHWRISEALHRRIHWHVANITSPSDIEILARAHVIFCRNVFIYFSVDSIRRTVKMFAERMRSPGYLFVGASESLLRVTSEFVLREIDGAFVYMKTPAGG